MTSIIIGRILGTFLFIFSISMLIDFKHYKKVAKDLMSHGDTLAISGTISTLVGLIVVIFHNWWDQEWSMIITIVGWIILIIGVIRLLFPRSVMKWAKSLTDNGLMWILWIILIVGAYIMYMSYFYVQNHMMS